MMTMRTDWLRGVTQAPLATALGSMSIGLIAGVLAVGHGGKLTILQLFGLGAAVLLAVLATAQAARAGRVTPDAGETTTPSTRRTAASRRKP